MTTKTIFKPLFRGALLSVLSLCATFSSTVAANDGIDRIVAIVNDDVVVRSELENDIRTIVAQLRQSGKQLPSLPVLEKQVLDRLIMKKLQISAAERAGISVGPEIVAQALSNIARKNNLSLSQFREALEGEGISYTAFRNSIRDQILLQRLREQKIRRNVRVSDQEVAALVSRQAERSSGRSAYHLRHILISTPDAASPEQLSVARQKAGETVDALRKGADFHTTALTQSDGGKALEGGDLAGAPPNSCRHFLSTRWKRWSAGRSVTRYTLPAATTSSKLPTTKVASVTSSPRPTPAISWFTPMK